MMLLQIVLFPHGYTSPMEQCIIDSDPTSVMMSICVMCICGYYNCFQSLHYKLADKQQANSDLIIVNHNVIRMHFLQYIPGVAYWNQPIAY